MRVLPTKTHAVIDYLLSVLLIAAPWLFNFSVGGAATWVPVIFGSITIIYSLVTDYQLSFAKAVSMPAHLTLDIWAGILLAGSPWIFKFNDVVYLPHLIIGILEVAAALCTERTTYASTHRAPGTRHHGHAH